MKYYDKIKKVALPIYLILLMVGFLYVKNVLNEERIEIEEKKDEKSDHVEVKPVVVYLKFYNNNSEEEYRARLQNVDSILDFLEHLMEEEDFTFTKEMHTYGIEYPSVNGIESPEGYKWRLFENNIDITNISHDKELGNEEKVYEMRLTRISELQ